jgi:threonyl-tRNA synthetase
MTPLIYRKQLWRISGHLENYRVCLCGIEESTLRWC